MVRRQLGAMPPNVETAMSAIEPPPFNSCAISPYSNIATGKRRAMRTISPALKETARTADGSRESCIHQ